MKKLLEFIKKLFGNSGSSEKGFTLIELLIVIAVIGVLAAAVLIALNPLEQFKRARDAGLKQSISTIGNQLQTNFTLTQSYPTFGANWLSVLVTNGELKSIPADPGTAVSCTDPDGGGAGSASVQNNICYKTMDSEFVIYAHPAANIERVKAATGSVQCAVGNTWYIYQSKTGKSGTICNSGQPMSDSDYTYFE